MHKITSTDNGEIIGLTDTPNYIRLSQNGCYVSCAEKDAQGVAYNSTPFHLFGKSGLADLPTVLVNEVDSGKEIESLQAENKSLSDQLTQAQLALCDVYEHGVSSEAQLTETQLALCDVYEQLIALTSSTEGGETA